MERPFERLIIVGPLVLTMAGIWATVAIGRDRGLAAAGNSLIAFTLPVLWGAVVLSLYCQFGHRLRSIHQFFKIVVPTGMGVLLGLLMFSTEGPTALLLFGLGAVLGVFILLQSPDLRPTEIRARVLEIAPSGDGLQRSLSPGLLVIYASVATGLALTSLFIEGL